MEQGQLHLGAAFGGSGVLGKDVEDHRCTVDGRSAQDGLEVALLSRGEVVIEDDRVGVDGQADRPQFFGLPGSEEGGRIGRRAALDETLGDVGAGRVHQQGQFIQGGLGLGQGGVGEDHADQHDALPDGAGDEGVGECRLVGGHASSGVKASTGPGWPPHRP